MKTHDYKKIHINVDKNNKIYALPTGLYPERNVVVSLNILYILEAPYSDKQLEQLVFKTFDQCYSEEIENINAPGILLEYFNVKSYSKAVKGLKWIGIYWNNDEGYTIIPSNKVPKRGYVHLVDKKKTLGLNPKEGEIAEALRQAIEESTTF